MNDENQAESKFSESWVAQNIIRPIPFNVQEFQNAA